MSQKNSLKKQIIALLQKASIALPEDVISGLKKARDTEKNSSGRNALSTILSNIDQAKIKSRAICQDTGTPIFYITYPNTYTQLQIKKTVQEALNIATKKVPLRNNTASVLSNKILRNEPVIHFNEGKKLEIKVLMKGAGSENVSAVYRLPEKKINANRDLDGIGKCIIETVFKAQGKGCPPYIIGVAVGGSIEEVAFLSKKQLLRKLTDKNPDKTLCAFEEKMLKKVNQLKIGPLGLGGRNTALAVKIATTVRHPASFFVGVSMGCWCTRRQTYQE